MKYFKHHLSDVQTEHIGDDTKIWQFSVVLKNAKIGKNCNINAQVFVENDVVIGDNVTIKSGVQIWDGIVLEDNVFVGPNVTFTNDLVPRSKQYPLTFDKTRVRTGASIGANVTVIAGIEIGHYSMIGAGSVVTKNVLHNELWFGNPAIKKGYITDDGILLNLDLKASKTGKQYIWENNKLKKLND
jgi:UDP-2-acetamido-3-amino-2,3-dideoxy-glucuronate N-acetyltransferase